MSAQIEYAGESASASLGALLGFDLAAVAVVRGAVPEDVLGHPVPPRNVQQRIFALPDRQLGMVVCLGLKSEKGRRGICAGKDVLVVKLADVRALDGGVGSDLRVTPPQIDVRSDFSGEVEYQLGGRDHSRGKRCSLTSPAGVPGSYCCKGSAAENDDEEVKSSAGKSEEFFPFFMVVRPRDASREQRNIIAQPFLGGRTPVIEDFFSSGKTTFVSYGRGGGCVVSGLGAGGGGLGLSFDADHVPSPFISGLLTFTASGWFGVALVIASVTHPITSLSAT